MNLNEVQSRAVSYKEFYEKSSVTSEEYRDKTGKLCKVYVFSDEEPMNPREEPENLLGTMLYSSRSYLLGDTLVERGTTPEAHAKTKDVIALPVYAYIHGNVSLRTGSFKGLVPGGHYEFDSGQCGWIYTTYENVRKWYQVKRITKQVKEKVIRHLESEVEEFSRYLSGEVYGFKTFDVDSGEEIDSCWGIYDSPQEIIKQVKAGGY